MVLDIGNEPKKEGPQAYKQVILEVLNLDSALVWPQFRMIYIEGNAESDLEESTDVVATYVLPHWDKSFPK